MERRSLHPSVVWPILGSLLLLAGIGIALAGWGNWWILVASLGGGLLGSGLVVYSRARRRS